MLDLTSIGMMVEVSLHCSEASLETVLMIVDQLSRPTKLLSR